MSVILSNNGLRQPEPANNKFLDEENNLLEEIVTGGSSSMHLMK